jgi:hypothetical protein
MKPIAGKEIDPEPAIQTHQLYEKYILYLK